MANSVDTHMATSEQAPSGGGGDTTPSTTGSSSRPNHDDSSHATSEPVPIGRRRTPSPGSAGPANVHEGPITPRNDAGPWVFDGSGARIGVAPTGGASASASASAGTRQSLNGVVDMEMEE